MNLPVYLDNHSTTRVDPRVVDAMVPYLSERYGNAASRQHELGWVAEAAVEKARGQIASLIGAQNEEIVFTSGATESINLAIKGVAEAQGSKGGHVITAATEHKAVLDTCARLGQSGFRVTVVPVDGYGMISPDDIKRAMRPETILVTVMMANNEIGTIARVAEIGGVCRERGVLFHTDAAQAAGKIPVDVSAMNIDLMSMSAHKMYGPKGVGALYIRRTKPRILLVQQIDGGGHEGGLRSGTLNVPAIVGFGLAAEIAGSEMTAEAASVRSLRDRLVDGITAGLGSVRVNGHPVERLPNNANLTVAGTRADALMMAMKDVAVSAGSACSSASPEPSHVLRAIGLADDDVLASIRFGLGRFTTAEEIDYAVRRVVETVKSARKKTMFAGIGEPA